MQLWKYKSVNFDQNDFHGLKHNENSFHCKSNYPFPYSISFDIQIQFIQHWICIILNFFSSVFQFIQISNNIFKINSKKLIGKKPKNVLFREFLLKSCCSYFKIWFVLQNVSISKRISIFWKNFCQFQLQIIGH